MVDACYFCQRPLGSVFTYHWGNPCHSECVPMDEKDRRIAALRAELEKVKRERDDYKRKWEQACAMGKVQAEAAERLAGARVKPLEWDEAIHGGWVALGAAGVYHVHVGHRNETRFYFFTNPFDHEPNEFCSEEKAKAAAQADYERRILSALAETAGEAEPRQFLATEDGEFNGNTFCEGVDVPFGWITQRAYDHTFSTSNPVQVTILRNESGPGLMPRVALYTAPPASAIREAFEIPECVLSLCANRITLSFETDEDASSAFETIEAALAGSAE